MKTVFEYTDYRVYLASQLGEAGTRSGLRLKASQFLGCHSTYLSQVMAEKIHLSLEHAEALNSFFKHSKDESEFFLLLVLRGRAGTTLLKDRFTQQMKEIKNKRNQIKNRVSNQAELSPADRDRFYSNWIYGAIHVLVSIQEFQTLEGLSRALGMDSLRLAEELEFMIKTGFIVKNKNLYTMGPKMVHLGADSVAINKHHTNWRFHTIQNLNRTKASDVHYSASVSLSREAADQIRESLLKNLEAHIKTIEKSKEETAYVYCFDFYSLPMVAEGRN